MTLGRAALIGAAVAPVAWLALGWFAEAHACHEWLRRPLLDRLCASGGAEGWATALLRLGWTSALPVMLGVAAFLAAAFRPRR